MQPALWNRYEGKNIPLGVPLVLVNSDDLFLPFVQAFLLLFPFVFNGILTLCSALSPLKTLLLTPDVFFFVVPFSLDG